MTTPITNILMVIKALLSQHDSWTKVNIPYSNPDNYTLSHLPAWTNHLPGGDGEKEIFLGYTVVQV